MSIRPVAQFIYNILHRILKRLYKHIVVDKGVTSTEINGRIFIPDDANGKVKCYLIQLEYPVSPSWIINQINFQGKMKYIAQKELLFKEDF